MYIAYICMQVSGTEVTWVMRVSVVVTGIMAAVLAIAANQVIGLAQLTFQFAFIVLFPALICALFVPFTNAWGCLIGVVAGIFLGISAGEPLLGIPALFRYPLYYEDWQVQGFPFRVVGSLCVTLCIIAMSWMTGKWCRRSINQSDTAGERQDSEQRL